MITEAYSNFFRRLEKNNQKEWFHANKKHYENDVKAPFLELVQALLPALKEWDNRILDDPKKSLFRINRDVRFSKDKSPYNTILKAGFSPGGKKSELPGYYLGIDAEHVHVGGGLFMVRRPELKNVRRHIANNPERLVKLVEAKDFISAFGQLKGEKAKRIDKEFLSISDKTSLIYNKQFYAFAEFPLCNFYNSNRLVGEVLEHFAIIKPINAFLNGAFNPHYALELRDEAGKHKES